MKPRLATWLLISIFGLTFQDLSGQSLQLLSNLNYVKYRGTDVWEYIDSETGNVYAICGDDDDDENSVVIIDVTDPGSPFLVSRIDSTPGFDVKVWGHYIYSVYGGGPKGAITDISDVRSPKRVGDFTAGHNVFIDENGFLYTTYGTIYSLLPDPTLPTLVSASGTGYAHDITVRDDLMISCDGGAGTFVYDITDRSAPDIIMQFTEQPLVYHHQGDFSEDRNFLFISDELVTGLIPDISIWDISDRDNPELIGGIIDSVAISHNLYVRGDYMYVSYYGAGLKVFDVSDPYHTFLVDQYVTSGSLESHGFYGAWGVYPSPTTGNIYVTDWDQGLFVFRLESSTTSVSNEDPDDGTFVCYPNPAQDKINATWMSPSSGPFTIVLRDISGKVLQDELLKIRNDVPEWSTVINVSGYASGIYFLSMQSKSQVVTKKVIID